MQNETTIKERHSTTDVDPSFRLEYWRDLVCDTFVELSCESVSKDNFTGEIKTSGLGESTYSVVNSVEQHVVRDRSRINKSSSNNFLLSLQISGQCHLSQDGRQAVLKRGDMALYDVTRPYDLRFDEEFQQLVVQIQRDSIAGRFFDTQKITAHSISGTNGIARLAFSLFEEISQQIDNVNIDEFTRAHFHALDLFSAAIAEKFGHKNNQISRSSEMLVRRAIDYIERSLRQETLSVSSVAEAVGVSDRYLRKQFRDKDYSLSEWIWLRRLENARIDLMNTLKMDVSVMSIAYSWGFKDPAHFSRAFKKRFGCSPGEYRSTHVAKMLA